MKSDKRYVAMVTLYFGNGQLYIKQGQRYDVNDYLFAKGIANMDSNLNFTDDEENTFKLSNEKGSLGDYRKLFKVIKSKAL